MAQEQSLSSLRKNAKTLSTLEPVPLFWVLVLPLSSKGSKGAYRRRRRHPGYMDHAGPIIRNWLSSAKENGEWVLHGGMGANLAERYRAGSNLEWSGASRTCHQMLISR